MILPGKLVNLLSQMVSKMPCILFMAFDLTEKTFESNLKFELKIQNCSINSNNWKSIYDLTGKTGKPLVANGLEDALRPFDGVRCCGSSVFI